VKIKTNTFRKAKILPEALFVGKEFWSGTFAPRDLGVLRKAAVLSIRFSLALGERVRARE